MLKQVLARSWLVIVSLQCKAQEETTEPIKSLCLKMRDDRVLFEYKLSGKSDKLLEEITNYVHGEEES